MIAIAIVLSYTRSPHRREHAIRPQRPFIVQTVYCPGKMCMAASYASATSDNASSRWEGIAAMAQLIIRNVARLTIVSLVLLLILSPT